MRSPEDIDEIDEQISELVSDLELENKLESHDSTAENVIDQSNNKILEIQRGDTPTNILDQWYATPADENPIFEEKSQLLLFEEEEDLMDEVMYQVRFILTIHHPQRKKSGKDISENFWKKLTISVF